MLTALAVVQVGFTVFSRCLEQCDLYGGQVRNPRRNLPLSLALGTGIVLLLYILCNLIYLAVLPLHGDVAGTDDDCSRVFSLRQRTGFATAVMEQAFSGYGARIMAAAI